MVSTTTHHRAASSAQQAAGAASSPKPAQSTAATVAAASRGKRVTPGPPHQDLHSKALQDRMTVDKNVVNELLLVCGVIGTTEQQHEDNNASSSQQRRLVPVTDCLEWLQDLQRAIRRDDDLYRPISIWMAHHNVVQHKLLPLTMHSRADTALVLTACKILVILTKPLSENAIRAGQRVLDPHKTHASVLEEQKKLRENATEQADALMKLKHAFAYHESHLTIKSGKQEEGGLFSIFVSLLAEPLSRTGTARTDADHLTIELVLRLLINLLAVEPLFQQDVATSRKIHNDLVTVLESELVLEVVLVLAADLELRENVQYNLLVMELLHHLLRYYDPTAVARSAEPAKKNKKREREGQLMAALQRERKSRGGVVQSRHSHFVGGSHAAAQLLLAGGGGRVHDERRRRKTKQSEPFIGGSTNVAAAATPDEKRACQTLHNFCQRFVSTCYGPVMKSLKNEFRRDSVRLEDGDRVIFFRTVWFFCQWWRVSSKQRGGDKLMESSDPQDKLARKSSIGQLIFTMDVFSFNLVLNAVDTFQQHKKYARLAQAVALLSEMMHLLQALYSSKDSTDHVMALGLLDRLYYGQEPIDRLPKLLSQWEAGTSTREYLGDLLEVCHMTLKLLDINAKACQGAVDNKHDTVAKMKATAAEFDVSSYFFRKIATNHIVWMVTQLLAQYAGNPPHVNHRIVSLFLRLTKHVVTTPDERDADGPQNLLSTKTVTLEPMLYNIHTLQVFHTILNDSTIRNDKNFSTLLSFVSTVIRNFATAAESNPVLFVEALFKHPFPHRFCELATNLYVTEELRMIAERELLLEEQQRWEREAAAAQEDDEESEDEELEFTDDVGATNTSTLLKSKGDEGEKGSDDENKPAPKKSEAKDLQDSDDEGEDDSRLREKTTKSANKTKELQKRIRALNAPDGASSSSDEEDFGGESSPKKPRVFEEEEED